MLKDLRRVEVVYVVDKFCQPKVLKRAEAFSFIRQLDDPMASAKANPKVKDFKKLNKVVLAEGATNSCQFNVLLSFLSCAKL